MEALKPWLLSRLLLDEAFPVQGKFVLPLATLSKHTRLNLSCVTRSSCPIFFPDLSKRPQIPDTNKHMERCSAALAFEGESKSVSRSVVSDSLCDPKDCNSPGSSVHGILQARILKWVAIPFSRASSRPRDQTWVSALQADSLLSEPPGKP